MTSWQRPPRQRPEQLERLKRELLSHLGPVFDTAVRLCGSRVEAEDLVQEVYERALGATDRLDPAAPARPWLFTILYNLVRNRRRQQGRHPEVELEEEADLSADAPEEPPAWAGLTPEMLDLGVQQLPLKLREPLVLRDLQGLSYREVAEVLDIPAGTVMSRLHRARRQLRALLAAAISAVAGSPQARRRP